MSVAAIQARIAQIHSRFPAPPATPAAPGQFQAALSAAVETAPAPAGTAAPATTAGAAGLEPWSPSPFTTSSTMTAPTASTASTASSAMTAAGAPTDLAKYGNGKIPASALSDIGGGHRLWQPAAEGFKKMMAAARAAGVEIGVTDSYRSYEQQVDVAERKGLYSQGGLAAKPGTSDHGWGKSVDLDLNPEAQAWMRANGKKYGFVEDVPREPWHWTFGGDKG